MGELQPRDRGRHWLQPLLELVFPTRCLGCGRPGGVWCAQCDNSLERLHAPYCDHCGDPLPRRAAICRRCSLSGFPIPVRSFARYHGPLARALVQLKYRPTRAMADVMGAWLQQTVLQAGWEPQLVVPVPLGRGRLRMRGYNQVALIASSLAGNLGIEACPTAITRTRETPLQVGLDAAARRRNVHGAFLARPQAVQNKSVCLVDDLMTTGATLLACAEAVRAADCREIMGVTVGRA